MYLGKQHHIAVIASSWERAKEFYIDKLGFQLIGEHYRPTQNDYLRMLRQGDIRSEGNFERENLTPGFKSYRKDNDGHSSARWVKI